MEDGWDINSEVVDVSEHWIESRLHYVCVM